MKLAFFKQDWITGLAAVLLAVLLGGLAWLQPLERWAYDVGMSASAARQPSERLVVIALDDAAVERFGAWPWPPGVMADLFAQLYMGGRPRAVGVMPPFEFPVNEQGLDYIRRLRVLQNPGWSREAANLLTQAEATLDDTQDLAASFTAAGSVVLAMPQRIGGPLKGPAEVPAVFVRNRLRAVDTGRPVVDAEWRLWPPHVPFQAWWVDLTAPPEPLTAVPLPPQALLGQAASGAGILPREVGSAGVREQALVYRHRGLYLPSFSLLMAARTLELDRNDIAVTLGQGVRIGEHSIPTDDLLRVWPYFYDTDDGNPFATYSILDVLDGTVTAQDFADRTVLIGPTTARLVPMQDTPAGELPPVLTEAHIISSLLGGYVYETRGWAQGSGWLALAVIALYLIFVLPRLRSMPGALFTLGILAVLANLQFILMNSFALRVQFVVPAAALLIGHVALVLKHLLEGRVGRFQAELSETHRRLGEAYQEQSQLDLAFDQYRRCLNNEEVLQLMFNLGLDYERRRKFAKAISTFKHIKNVQPDYPDLDDRIRRNEELERHYMLTGGVRVFDPIETAMLEGDNMTRPMLGRYQIEKVVGRGAMGVVYLGRDIKIGRVVAVKTLALAQEFEGKQLQDVMERFFREAETAGRLNHPNIVTVYDVGEEHDVAYIAMDFLTGENLQAYCEPEKRLDVAKVLDIAAQVAEALDYAHSRNVVHRDIKPANIIYDAPSGRVSVTDFGVAYLTDTSKTKTGTILGSPSYMSPEQVQGLRVDGRSDLFSLGVTMFELLSSELPFVGEPVATLMYRIANEDHPDITSLRPDLPQCARIIINKLLQKDQEKRYQTGMALATALRRCSQSFS